MDIMKSLIGYIEAEDNDMKEEEGELLRLKDLQEWVVKNGGGERRATVEFGAKSVEKDGEARVGDFKGKVIRYE